MNIKNWTYIRVIFLCLLIMPSGLTYFYHIETYYTFIFIVLTFITSFSSDHFIQVWYLCDCIYTVSKVKTNYIDTQYSYVLNYLCCYLYNIYVFVYVFRFWLRENIFFTWRLTQETYSMLKTAIRKCFVRQQKLTIVSILLCLLNSHYRCANLLTRLYSSIMILLGYLKYSCIVTL